jgi:hypothetical protein
MNENEKTEIEPFPHDASAADRRSRIRRATYAFLGTFGGLGGSIGLAVGNYDSVLAQKVVDGLMSFAQLMAMMYLGAGVLDRSAILSKIGDGFRRENDSPIAPPKEGE